jgi:hypothetical protein
VPWTAEIAHGYDTSGYDEENADKTYCISSECKVTTLIDEGKITWE